MRDLRLLIPSLVQNSFLKSASDCIITARNRTVRVNVDVFFRVILGVEKSFTWHFSRTFRNQLGLNDILKDMVVADDWIAFSILSFSFSFSLSLSLSLFLSTPLSSTLCA